MASREELRAWMRAKEHQSGWWAARQAREQKQREQADAERREKLERYLETARREPVGVIPVAPGGQDHGSERGAGDDAAPRAPADGAVPAEPAPGASIRLTRGARQYQLFALLALLGTAAFDAAPPEGKGR